MRSNEWKVLEEMQQAQQEDVLKTFIYEEIFRNLGSEGRILTQVLLDALIVGCCIGCSKNRDCICWRRLGSCSTLAFKVHINM